MANTDVFMYTNPNPDNKSVGDCTVRALSIALNKPWAMIYLDLCIQGYMMSDMPSSNDVWGTYLQDKGWMLRRLQDTCPLCYTVIDFCNDHNRGTYILGTGTHVVCVKNGKYYDAWDSGTKVPLFYYEKGK